MNNIRKKVCRFFKKHSPNQAGIGLIATALLAACGALVSLVGILYSLGFSDDAREYQRIHREAIEAAQDPSSTPTELNGHLTAVRNAVSQAADKAPLTNTVKPWLIFGVRQNTTIIQNTVKNSDVHPLTVLNLTNSTGKDCGAKPVTVDVSVDGGRLGSVGPGRAISTEVSPGNHTVVGCFPSPYGCPSVSISVPKNTTVSFFWVCTPPMPEIPLQLQPGVETLEGIEWMDPDSPRQ